MSGSFRVGKAADVLPHEKHDHVIIGLERDIFAIYNDPRRFGFFDIIDGWNADAYPSLAKMGPEPLGQGFHPSYLYQRLQDVSSPIKTALLNQDLVAGLGNIYVCEALYRAGIHPKRKASRIGHARCAALVGHIKDVLLEAIAAGGSSLQDHKNVDGALGYFQHRFSVYDREGEYCPDPGCAEKSGPCVRRIVQAGRSSFYCINTQR
jgi:formamidopyrimidine-DNA glycosylase